MKTFLTFCFCLLTAIASAQTAIRETLQPYVDAQTMAGFVSILAAPDYSLEVECVGWADVENKVPMRPDTMFAIFSSSKSVCGAALMMLIDEGKISLDDPVSKYLPEFADVKIEVKQADGSVKLEAPKRELTIRDCMSHVTGSRMWFPLRSKPLREVARQLAATPLKFQPGETFSYGNAWIDTGAAILEVVSGQKYEEFLQKRIFDPLGMVDTTFWPNAEQQKRLAKCYNGDGKPVKDAHHPWLTFPQQEVVYADAAGGLYSTPQDFIKFSQMLAHHGEYKGLRLINQKTFDEILCVKQTPDGISEPYTVGNWIFDAWLGHEGALRTDARANIQTGCSRLYFVQTTAGPAFAESKKKWHETADRLQKTEPPYNGN